MSIVIDHIFICCEPDGPEAQALIETGLVEGSRNVHPGQGTANRRFFFHGGFIELLWVHNPQEATSPLTAPTRLWPRWHSRNAGSCPFGIAFGPEGDDVHPPPFRVWPYRPIYLPETKSILFAEGTTLMEPELFYMAWPNPQASSASQPNVHPNGLQRLLSASVGVPAKTSLCASSQAVQSAGLVGFYTASQYELRLNFAADRSEVFDLRPTLPLVMSASRNAA